MSKKHFIAIASDIKVEVDQCETDRERQRIDSLARNLAWTFANFNSNFDRQRFLTACGL